MKGISLFIAVILLNVIVFGQNTTMASGSGIVLTKDGYIATNNHVIENGVEYFVDIFTNGVKKSYKAKVIQADKENDLAVIKIEDPLFNPFKSIPYAFRMQGVNVGEKVFAMGYPRPGLQGEEVKITDGLISSKTGFQNDNKTYQISAPIQPGNSGGPLFDYSGNLIGLTSSGIPSGENVGYAIKISYLNNLLDLIPNFPTLNQTTTITNLSFTEKIKNLSNYTVMIRVKIPVCDLTAFSDLYDQINYSYTVEMINKLFEIEGIRILKSEHTDMYNWMVCKDDANGGCTVTASFIDGKLSQISKSFDDRSKCLQITPEICSAIKIGLSYDEILSIVGIEGDKKLQAFQFSMIKMFIWYDCYSSNFVTITFDSNNKVMQVMCH
jgi:V8-like Glu-specific endopeptidase